MPQAIPYNVPLPASLPKPIAPTVEFRMNQQVRLFLQILGTPFASKTAMQTKANWDALIAASDATTIVYTPLFSGTKITQSKKLEVGADTNTTYRGIPEYYGEGVGMVSGDFRSKDPINLNSLALLTQFSLMNTNGLTSLGAYLLNNDGMFFCNADFSPFPIYNFALRTRGTEGLNAADVVGFDFTFPPNWDASLTCVIPTFDPRLYI